MGVSRPQGLCLGAEYIRPSRVSNEYLRKNPARREIPAIARLRYNRGAVPSRWNGDNLILTRERQEAASEKTGKF
jgi:hypothetical protein